MRHLNKIATAFCAAALGLLSLSSCEGGDLYGIDAPDWLSSKADSIANSKNQGGDDVIEGLEEDVYTIGNTDYTSGWWSSFSKYYQIPDGKKWVAQFNLNINPNDNTYYKNFALVISSDADRGAADYVEYGAFRYDFTNDSVTYNSQWGTDLYFKFAESTQPFSPVDNADAGLQKMNGKVTLTIDRSDDSKFAITISNGTVIKTYNQPFPLRNLNADPSNTTIRAFLVPEGSFINFLGSTIEPIGGFTSAEDKQPLSMELTGVPSEVLVGTDLNEAMANVTAVVTFEQGVTKTVTAEDLQFQAIPNMEDLGQKTLVVLYNKTFKGANCDKPIIASKAFSVVKELSAFTATYVVPTPLTVGAADNSTGFWGAHSDNIKIEPKETKMVSFTNYSSCENNWNNFVLVLCRADNTEYAVVRADNYGWGDNYASCTPQMEEGRDWDVWRAAMDGAKVTAYITNNGDGTADIKAVMVGNDGATYTQQYTGMKNIDPDNFYFNFTVDGCHLVFDNAVGAADNSTGFWGAHTPNIQVVAHQVCTVNFTNYSSCENNWNNFVLVLCRADNSEYAVVRADNYGWGDGYAACKPAMEEGRDWDVWRPAMNGAEVTAQIVNNGDGTVDVKATMVGNNGVTYTQDYIGINTIDPDNFYFNFTVDGSHLVFK